MKTRAIALAAGLGIFLSAAQAQMSVSGDVTGFGSYGIAGPAQAMDSVESGVYATEKNGYYTNANLAFKASLDSLYDVVVKVYARGRTGSPYRELQLATAASSTMGLTLDQAYGRMNILDGLRIAAPVDLFATVGKFPAATMGFGRVGRYGLEAPLGMLKLSSQVNAGIEIEKDFLDGAQYTDAGFATLILQVVANLLSDEAVQRLYDTDGSMSSHGKVVLGEDAPQFFASLKLANYVLPFGILSAEGAYTLNGASIYSGHSFGLSAGLLIPLGDQGYFLPLGLGGAYYQKNIDPLGASTGTGLLDATVDFRDSFRAGFGLGFRYTVPFETEAEASLGASFSQVGHIYRDPLRLFGLSLDVRYGWAGRWYLGGGVILPTLTEAHWATRADVSSLYDDYHHVWKPLENLGYEAYVGITIGLKSNLSLGVNNNRGLAMNYGLESLRDGEMKYLQSGSGSADGRYETFGVFLKTSYRM